MIGSLAVLAAAIAIPRTGWRWLDAAVSVGVALFILPRAVALLRQSAHILLEGAPGEIDSARSGTRSSDLPGVEELHDLHLLDPDVGPALGERPHPASPESGRGSILQAVQRLLKEEAGIDHTTIQVERGAEMTCHASSNHA